MAHKKPTLRASRYYGTQKEGCRESPHISRTSSSEVDLNDEQVHPTHLEGPQTGGLSRLIGKLVEVLNHPRKYRPAKKTCAGGTPERAN